MGVSNPKYFCTECQWAAKGPCPQHPGSSLMMGKNWRPGRKGTRTRLWDNRRRGFRPPPGLVVLGAKDFSHNGTSLNLFGWHDDPVREAIRVRAGHKPSRSAALKLSSGKLGWPFPFYRGH
jgi:hypothetical protein